MLVGRLTNEEKGQRGYVTSGPDAVKEMEGCDGIGRRPGMACLALQPEGPARAVGPASAKAGWWRTWSRPAGTARFPQGPSKKPALRESGAGPGVGLGCRGGPLSRHWPRALGTAFRPIFSAKGW